MLIYGILIALGTSLASWILNHIPKRKESELTPAKQFKRFGETAKKFEVDESGKPLDAFKNAGCPKEKSPGHQKS